LRDAGYDAVTTEEANRKGASDEEQLTFAIAEGRAILTHNARHFAPLVRALFLEGVTHYGGVVSSHLEKGDLLRRVLALLPSAFGGGDGRHLALPVKQRRPAGSPL